MFYEIYVKQGEDWVLVDCGLSSQQATKLIQSLEALGHQVRAEPA